MSTYSTEALLLKATQLREADLIFTLLLSDGSQVRAVARSIRKPKAKMGGVLRPFTSADLLLAQGKSLDTICEARAVEVPQGCEEDVEHSAAASAVCELLCKLSLPGQEQPKLYELSRASLRSIGQAPLSRVSLVTAAAILKIVSLLGYRPQLTGCVVCGNEVPAGTGKVAFSWPDGGVLCSRCEETTASWEYAEGSMVTWLHTLIMSTYTQLLELPEEADAVGEYALRFCERWLYDQVDVHLKSLSLLLRGL